MSIPSIISVILFNCSNAECNTLSRYENTSHFSFISRNRICEYLLFFSRELIKRTPKGTRQSVAFEKEGELTAKKFYGHCFVNRKLLGCVVITMQDYPFRVAHHFLNKVVDEYYLTYGEEQDLPYSDESFTLPNVPFLMQKYQNPETADYIMRIERDIEETKNILLTNLDNLLIRGEKLQNLMESTKDLSYQSKHFQKQAKEMNKCCTII